MSGHQRGAWTCPCSEWHSWHVNCLSVKRLLKEKRRAGNMPTHALPVHLIQAQGLLWAAVGLAASLRLLWFELAFLVS